MKILSIANVITVLLIGAIVVSGNTGDYNALGYGYGYGYGYGDTPTTTVTHNSGGSSGGGSVTSVSQPSNTCPEGQTLAEETVLAHWIPGVEGTSVFTPTITKKTCKAITHESEPKPTPIPTIPPKPAPQETHVPAPTMPQSPGMESVMALLGLVGVAIYIRMSGRKQE